MSSRYFTPPRPRLFGHRGFPARFPENTLPSFAAALAAGLPYLELDVWASRDGHVVVHHDETLYRMCGKWRRIRNLNWAEIKSCDTGRGFRDRDGRRPFLGQGIAVPSLEEVFEACPEAFINIEIKQTDPPIEALVVETVRRWRREETVLLASAHDRVIKRLRALCGAIPTGFSRGEIAAFLDWVKRGCRSGYAPPGAALQVPVSHHGTPIVFPESVVAAHAVGIEIHVWTINDPSEMRRLLTMGVDGLMSDDAALLVATARESVSPFGGGGIP
ncbi:MAG: glycerophosphodiester phosphodiesterase [Deltaproteobacteria bacterium]|nr:glycerophosphodiester phosphodiesterase [Deltaproteobacteria bacterium]